MLNDKLYMYLQSTYICSNFVLPKSDDVNSTVCKKNLLYEYIT